jgi:hypothetical protein
MTPINAHDPMSLHERFLNILPLIKPNRAIITRQHNYRKNIGAATVWKRVLMYGPAKRRYIPMLI